MLESVSLFRVFHILRLIFCICCFQYKPFKCPEAIFSVHSPTSSSSSIMLFMLIGVKYRSSTYATYDFIVVYQNESMACSTPNTALRFSTSKDGTTNWTSMLQSAKQWQNILTPNGIQTSTQQWLIQHSVYRQIQYICIDLFEWHTWMHCVRFTGS